MHTSNNISTRTRLPTFVLCLAKTAKSLLIMVIYAFYVIIIIIIFIIITYCCYAGILYYNKCTRTSPAGTNKPLVRSWFVHTDGSRFLCMWPRCDKHQKYNFISCTIIILWHVDCRHWCHFHYAVAVHREWWRTLARILSCRILQTPGERKLVSQI